MFFFFFFFFSCCSFSYVLLQEDGGQAEHEERGGAQGAGLAAAADLVHRGAGHEGEVGRHDRQHAGRQEAQEPGRRGDEQRGRERGVPEVYSEHAAAIRVSGAPTLAAGDRRVTRGSRHIAVDSRRRRG